jgi:ferredoxin
MKMIVDPETCNLCGVCADLAPDVFEMGDEYAIVLVDPVPADQEESALEAEEDCPEGAISHE